MKSKIYLIHFKDAEGHIGNYKPIQAPNKKQAQKVFKSYPQYKDCKILSVN